MFQGEGEGVIRDQVLKIVSPAPLKQARFFVINYVFRHSLQK
jgi:hypothetical protein